MKKDKVILIIDDEDVFLNLVTTMLQDYLVIPAKDCESAIEIYKENYKNIDIIILDLILPVVNGFECLNRILDINPDADVIVCSGAVSIYTLNNLTLKVKGTLSKPCTQEELIEIIEA